MVSDFWLDAAWSSALIVLGVTALSLLLAVPAAWLIERTDLLGAALLDRVLTLTYALPSYLLAIAWVVLANPAVGWINRFAGVLGAERAVSVYNLGGVVLVEASALFTILFFGVGAGLRQMDPALEEAARLAGASPIRVFFTITAPLLKGHLGAGLVAVALASLASFGVPAILGAPARRYVLTTAIYAKIQEGGAEAFREALLVSLGLAAVTLGLIVVTSRWSKRRIALVGGKASRPARIELGRWRRPLAALLFAVWGGLVLLPLAALVTSSFLAEPGVLSWSNLTLRSWRHVLFSLDAFRAALANSLAVAALAAVAVIAVSGLTAVAAWHGRYQDRRGLGRFGATTENGALFFYSLPGTVLALCLLIVATRLGRLGLVDTLAILVIAYVVKYATLGLQTVRPAALLIDPSLIESAQLAGAGWAQRTGRIWLPLLRPALFAAGFLVFLPCLSELTMSVLLCGPDTETLGVVLFNLQEYADRASAAVVGTLLLALVVVLRLAARRLEHGA